MSSELATSHTVLASCHGPINWMMNQVSDLAHQERYNECRLICALAAPVFALLSINYHILAIGLKMPVVLVNYTFLWVPIKVDRQWVRAGEHVLPAGFELTEMFKHLAKIAILALDIILCAIVGLFSPAAAINMHVAFGLAELKERPPAEPQSQENYDRESQSLAIPLNAEELEPAIGDAVSPLALEQQEAIASHESAVVNASWRLVEASNSDEHSQALVNNVEVDPLLLNQADNPNHQSINSQAGKVCHAHAFLQHSMKVHRKNFEESQDDWDAELNDSNVQLDKPEAALLRSNSAPPFIKPSPLMPSDSLLSQTANRPSIDSSNVSNRHVLSLSQSLAEIPRRQNALLSQINNFKKNRLKRVETKESSVLAKATESIQLDAEREAFLKRAIQSTPLVPELDEMPSAFDE